MTFLFVLFVLFCLACACLFVSGVVSFFAFFIHLLSVFQRFAAPTTSDHVPDAIAAYAKQKGANVRAKQTYLGLAWRSALVALLSAAVAAVTFRLGNFWSTA